jgi:aspartate aminotransferase-like enzyme
MQAYEARKPSYFATPAVQLVQALRVSLRQILAQTPDINDRCGTGVRMAEWLPHNSPG